MSTIGQTRGRLAIVLSHPTQYYSPWFQWLRASTGLRFRVFYLWDFGVVASHDPQFQRSIQWDIDLLGGYDHELVPNVARAPGAEHFFGFDNPSLLGRIGRWQPDCILLFGYHWAAHLRVVAWARGRNIPVLFRGDSHLIGRPPPRVHVLALLHLLFSQFSGFLYVGAANREYFARFGVPPERLFFCPHSVNGAFFNPEADWIRERTRALRARIGIGPATRVILFAGKLVANKQAMELMIAFRVLGPRDAVLVFVGDGPEKPRLQAVAAESGQKNIRFLPFANQTDMPACYQIADVFVLPSLSETWGLAVNEAMSMGVPCIVSDRAGCQRDLVDHGHTGWTFDPGRPGALAAVLGEALDLLDDEARSADMRRSVAARISRYSYARTTEGLIQALESLD